MAQIGFAKIVSNRSRPLASRRFTFFINCSTRSRVSNRSRPLASRRTQKIGVGEAAVVGFPIDRVP